MKRLNSSWVAVALAAAALFVSLGGTTWASNLITGRQITNGAINTVTVEKPTLALATKAIG